MGVVDISHDSAFYQAVGTTITTYKSVSFFLIFLVGSSAVELGVSSEIAR